MIATKLFLAFLALTAVSGNPTTPPRAEPSQERDKETSKDTGKETGKDKGKESGKERGKHKSHAVLDDKVTKDLSDISCNTPKDRMCWIKPQKAKKYDGNSDAGAEWPTGEDCRSRTRTYNFEISEKELELDGTPKLMQVINGIYPGPILEANWGDKVEIFVKNNLKINGTSMHWHGIVQANSTVSDGVNGVTECPIPPGATRKYEWTATQYGTSWYHSHYSGQYGDGALGPIIIHGPASANYDEDLGPFPLSDLYQDNMWITGLKAERGAPPIAKGGLINGTMKNSQGGGAYANVVIEKGTTYRLRLINTAVDAGFTVSLDDHPFRKTYATQSIYRMALTSRLHPTEVIGVDFTSIKPFTTNWLFVGIGQRYDILFTADQKPARYWFRAEIPDDCGFNLQSNKTTGVQEIFAIFSYTDAVDDPEPEKSTPKVANNQICEDTPGLTNFVPRSIDPKLFDWKDGPTDNFNVVGGERALPPPNNTNHWLINDSEIAIQWENPTLEYIAKKKLSEIKKMNGSNIYEMPEANKYYFWVIQNNDQTRSVNHPIHLHGHDFYILGRGTGFYDGSQKDSLDFKNPVRRDTTMLPGNGYLALAILTDNPGVWLLHCHIGWHVSFGFGIQFVEREKEILTMNKDGLTTLQENCKEWGKWQKAQKEGHEEPDSGL